jgi:hypothetical protein
LLLQAGAPITYVSQQSRARRRVDHAARLRARLSGPLAEGCRPARHATICNPRTTGRADRADRGFASRGIVREKW